MGGINKAGAFATGVAGGIAGNMIGRTFGRRGGGGSSSGNGGGGQASGSAPNGRNLATLAIPITFLGKILPKALKLVELKPCSTHWMLK